MHTTTSTTAAPATLSAPATDALPLSPTAIALDSIVSRIEQNERRRRAEDAAHLALLAEAFDLAAVQSVPGRHESSTPHGEHAELAYRAIRAELACAMRLSEQSIDRHLSHAFFLTTDYARTFEALRDGVISRQHTTVIVDAGMVIGVGDSPALVFRRAAYEAAVLAVAVEETPTRLRPIAKRLAEQYAEVTVDERHERARAGRSVCVIDREDGMSDLIAHLPAVEAHAIYGRLTRMARELEGSASETRRVDGEAPCADTQARCTDSEAPGTETEAERVDGEAPSVQPVSPQPASSQRSAEPAEGPVSPRRSRSEVRTDLFTDILLTGLTGTAPLPEVTGLAAISAQVQVTITDTALLTHLTRPESITHTESVSCSESLTRHESVSHLAGLSHRTDPAGLERPGQPPNTGRRFEREAVLAGYGPISSGIAAGLAATASQWQIATQNPVTGQVLAVESYRPSAEMRRLLAARDEHCRFPGCRTPVHRCDIDHTIDAAKGGSTATTNLAHLCRNHHVIKHHGGWRVTQHEQGDLEWRSPTGRRYHDKPPSGVRFDAARAAEQVLPPDEPLPF